jgi:DNA-binding MarR family transcriptional regulator
MQQREASTGALLREVARLHTHLQRSCVAYCGGTTVTQCTVLTELGRSGPVTLIELSLRVGFDKSWTSRAVEHLVQEGMIEKVASQRDRRTIRLSLSPAGERRLADLNQQLNALADQAMERIPAQEHTSIHVALEWLRKSLLGLTEEVSSRTSSTEQSTCSVASSPTQGGLSC